MGNICIGKRKGTLHFIRFPTSEMHLFLELAKSKGLATFASTICATGGGAYKFEDNFKRVSFFLSFLFIFYYKKFFFYIRSLKNVQFIFIVHIIFSFVSIIFPTEYN